MIRSLVEEIDADVAECSDGGAAIEAFEDLLPDWLLMDINMLPVDGLTAMRTILEKHPDARIIVISQYQDARTRDTALAMGAYAFVGKEDLTSVGDLIQVETDRDRLTGTYKIRQRAENLRRLYDASNISRGNRDPGPDRCGPLVH
jgi:CheY-like chemotaxis protein